MHAVGTVAYLDLTRWGITATSTVYGNMHAVGSEAYFVWLWWNELWWEPCIRCIQGLQQLTLQWALLSWKPSLYIETCMQWGAATYLGMGIATSATIKVFKLHRNMHGVGTEAYFDLIVAKWAIIETLILHRNIHLGVDLITLFWSKFN